MKRARGCVRELDELALISPRGDAILEEERARARKDVRRTADDKQTGRLRDVGLVEVGTRDSQACTELRGCEKFLPGPAWLLLSKHTKIFFSVLVQVLRIVT